MFAKIAVLLVACLVQVNCEWEFCKCKENSTEAIEHYDATVNNYFDKILKTQKEVLRDFSSQFADMNNEQKCTNTYYKKDPKDITLDLLVLCGGYPLRDRYFANWSTMKTENDVCNYISINGPQASALIKLNEEAISKCIFADKVNGILYKEFQQCEKGCSAA